jgi:hypothetical protein
MYLCEARIVRHPLFYKGPYKVVVVGARWIPGITTEVSADRLLGLKLRKSVDNLIRTKNAFAVQAGEKWVKMTKDESDKAVRKAIAYIKKDRIEQANSKLGWLRIRRN